MDGSNDYKTNSQQKFHTNGNSKQNSLGCRRNSVSPKSITSFLTSSCIIYFPQYPHYEKCELKVYNNQHSPLSLVPIYLEIKLNRGDLENTGHVNKKRALELKADKSLTKLIKTSDCTNTLYLTFSFQ